MRRITKAALGGLAGCAVILGTTQAANGEIVYYQTSEPVNLVDLPPVSPPEPSQEAFRDAEATLRLKETSDATNFKLTVVGINTSIANSVHGAHLHVGGCSDPTTGAPSLTQPGGHYKEGDPSAPATPVNEVWFDLVPNDFGDATDSTTVQFVPLDKDGVMSIVIHAQSAATPAASSPKLACFPLAVSSAPNWTD